MKIKYALLILLFSFTLSARPVNNPLNQFKSESHFFSEVITSENINGKPESHIRKMEFEEFRNKNNNENEKVRKYGEIVKKDNDSKPVVIRKASSNVEKEGLILSTSKPKKLLNKEESKKFIPEIKDNFEINFNPFNILNKEFARPINEFFTPETSIIEKEKLMNSNSNMSIIHEENFYYPSFNNKIIDDDFMPFNMLRGIFNNDFISPMPKFFNHTLSNINKERLNYSESNQNKTTKKVVNKMVQHESNEIIDDNFMPFNMVRGLIRNEFNRPMPLFFNQGSSKINQSRLNYSDLNKNNSLTTKNNKNILSENKEITDDNLMPFKIGNFVKYFF